MAIDKTFLGTGWGFPPEFSKRSKVVKMVSVDDGIRESLRILLLTSPGERIMRPDYGCGIKSLVFDNMSENTITQMKDMIERAILFFEPRITLQHIEVNIEYMYEGLVTIHFDYMIRTTNSRSNMVFPFYFREGTNVRS